MEDGTPYDGNDKDDDDDVDQSLIAHDEDCDHTSVIFNTAVLIAVCDETQNMNIRYQIFSILNPILFYANFSLIPEYFETESESFFDIKNKWKS